MLLAGTEAHRERDYDTTRSTGTGAYGSTGTDQYDPVTKKPITQKIAEAIPGGCAGWKG